MMISKFKTPTETKGTLKAYHTTWQKFGSYCEANGLNRNEMKVNDIANFLAGEWERGAVGSTIDAAITALDMTRRFLLDEAVPISQHPVIADLRKAAKIRRPPPRDSKPRHYFDPERIYDYLARQKVNKKLSNSDLRQKVEMLMVLDAAATKKATFRLHPLGRQESNSQGLLDKGGE
jgi:hypothetical protein